MKNLAPDIFRQRLLIEGFYRIEVNEKVINDYFLVLWDMNTIYRALTKNCVQSN